MVPKGFHDIQYISDQGVKEKWYEAIRTEHQKSEDNCTFEWISDEELEKLRKAKIPILRHVWYLNSSEAVVEITRCTRHVDVLMDLCNKKVLIAMKHSPLLAEKILSRLY